MDGYATPLSPGKLTSEIWSRISSLAPSQQSEAIPGSRLRMGLGVGADVWLALILGVPLLLLAWIFAYSKSLQLQAAKCGPGAQVPGNFWQLPLLGESIQLFFGARNPDDFLLPKIKRYGPIFRTHLIGRPTICVTSADAVKYVLQSQNLFTVSLPKSSGRLVGQHSILQVEGEAHGRLRKIVHAPLFPLSLRHFTPQVDRIARRCFEDWGAAEAINCAQELKTFAFLVGLEISCHSLKDSDMRNVLAIFHDFEEGLLALPLNIPGTAYSKALFAREKIIGILERAVEERLAEKGCPKHNDLLQSFLDWENDGQKLSRTEVLDNLLSIFFASHDTVGGTASLLMRNLCLYPTLAQEVKEEHDAIAKAKTSFNDPLSWDDLQQMPKSVQFLDETLRLDSPVSFTGPRETLHDDVMVNGMLIPKGWQVFVWLRMFHHDSKWYSDPYKFDPSRFNTKPQPNTFIPFGKGHRVCPGSELAKQEILVFLHRFLTTYKFEPAGPIDTRTRVFPVSYPKDGMPMKIKKRLHSLPN